MNDSDNEVLRAASQIIHLLLAASHPGPYAVCIPVQQVYRRCHRPDNAHHPLPPGQREYDGDNFQTLLMTIIIKCLVLLITLYESCTYVSRNMAFLCFCVCVT